MLNNNNCFFKRNRPLLRRFLFLLIYIIMNNMRNFLLISVIFLLSLINVFAEKEMRYNDVKNCWNVKDKKTNEIIICINSSTNSSSATKIWQSDKLQLSYPYQEGWPALLSCSIEYPMTIGDIDNDQKQEIIFQTYLDGKMRIYSHDGSPENYWVVTILSTIPTIGYIDLDNYLDLIATKAESGIMYGASVKNIYSQELSGFPNPPNTAFISAAVEDIDRDGNNDIAFAPYEKSTHNENYLGLYVLGSWGGLLPGFPVIFPWMFPGFGEPNINWASPSLGDFDDDGLLEIAVTTAPGMFYLIRQDGSHFRNWPIYLYNSAIASNPPAIGDIDNDGKLEIAIVTSNLVYKLYAFRSDASMLDGFPVDVEYLSYGGPSLADINQDGKLELFVATFSGKIFAINSDGESLPGWPTYSQGISFKRAPTIGDIDNDDEMEVIGAGGTNTWCPDSVLLAFNSDGTVVDNFPIIEIGYWPIRGVAVLTDLDNDGDIEICIHSTHCLYSEDPAYIFCYDLPYAYKKDKIAWGGICT